MVSGNVAAQVTVRGNVYCGGDNGEVEGSVVVNIKNGDD